MNSAATTRRAAKEHSVDGSPTAASRVAQVERRLIELQEAAQFSDLRDRLENVDTRLGQLPAALAGLRSQGYVFHSSLEERIAGLRRSWPGTRRQVQEAIAQRATDLERTSARPSPPSSGSSPQGSPPRHRRALHRRGGARLESLASVCGPPQPPWPACSMLWSASCAPSTARYPPSPHCWPRCGRPRSLPTRRVWRGHGPGRANGGPKDDTLKGIFFSPIDA